MTASRNGDRAWAWLENFLWVAGFLFFGYCILQWGRAGYAQATGDWLLRHHPPAQVSSGAALPEGSLVGSLEIPQLDFHAVVFEGTSEGTLARGVGHLTGSALPGGEGNLVLAGHRDSFFRMLKFIREGDTLKISGPEGQFDYAVDFTAIVNPDATGVLRPGHDAIVTLITCYPFDYIGNAPQRFVVRARKVS